MRISAAYRQVKSRTGTALVVAVSMSTSVAFWQKIQLPVDRTLTYGKSNCLTERVLMVQQRSWMQASTPRADSCVLSIPCIRPSGFDQQIQIKGCCI